MTHYNALNVKLYNPQNSKLKYGVKDGTEVTLKLSSNAVSGSNDATSFPQKLLLTSKQVSMLSKAFPNNSSANVKLSKTRLHETGKSGGFLGRLL